MSRRRLLAMLAAGTPIVSPAGRAVLGRPAHAARAQQPPRPPIHKPLPPEWFIDHGSNAEMRWGATSDLGLLVPNDRFFVRNHTATPHIDPDTWRLRLFGSGLKASGPVELTYEELLAMPAQTTTAVIECAGNGRRLFGDQQGTPAKGTPWGLGGIGAARWRGVPLADVLDRAGLRDSAVDVMAEGLDPTVVRDGVDHGHVRRPLPIDKARDDVLLAYEMNDQPLPPDHGFPVRLVVPGWVGIASVKWVGQIEVSDKPLMSPWNTDWYRMSGPDYPSDSPPLGVQPVKSAFEVAGDTEFPAHTHTVLRGRSWSGAAPIRSVEVSLDGGQQWQPAELEPGDATAPWARWQIHWVPPQPGRYEFLARATDETGQTQPDSVPFNEGGYQFWAVARHPITVS